MQYNKSSTDSGGEEEQEEDDEGDEEDTSKKRKPWGVSSYFCPVALKEQGVLWPGNGEHALKYRF